MLVIKDLTISEHEFKCYFKMYFHHLMVIRERNTISDLTEKAPQLQNFKRIYYFKIGNIEIYPQSLKIQT